MSQHHAALIDIQPSDALVTVGQTATFSVSASQTGEGTLSYQWLFGGAPLDDVPGKISGSTSSFLVIVNVQVSDTSQGYSVVVLKGEENVTSDNVILSICEFARPL